MTEKSPTFHITPVTGFKIDSSVSGASPNLISVSATNKVVALLTDTNFPILAEWPYSDVKEIADLKKYNETLINIKKTTQENYFNILGDKLKNVPKGIEPVSDTAAEFLKYKSIYINDEMPINKDFYSPELFSYTFDIFKKLKDFFIFLTNVVDNSKH